MDYFLLGNPQKIKMLPLSLRGGGGKGLSGRADKNKIKNFLRLPLANVIIAIWRGMAHVTAPSKTEVNLKMV